jgi:hypothetical protein
MFFPAPLFTRKCQDELMAVALGLPAHAMSKELEKQLN